MLNSDQLDHFEEELSNIIDLDYVIDMLIDIGHRQDGPTVYPILVAVERMVELMSYKYSVPCDMLNNFIVGNPILYNDELLPIDSIEDFLCFLQENDILNLMTLPKSHSPAIPHCPHCEASGHDNGIIEVDEEHYNAGQLIRKVIYCHHCHKDHYKVYYSEEYVKALADKIELKEK